MERGSVETCRSWKPALAGVTEVLHASFVDHAYPRHCHDTWTVLLIDDGAVSYGLDATERAADRHRVTVLPPHIAHDGRSALEGRRFRKRVLYIDTDTISDDLVGAAVDRPAIDDPALRRTISRLHRTLDRSPDDLEQETLLAFVVERLNVALAGRVVPHRVDSDAADALRACLDADPYRSRSLDTIAAELGWNATHLVRCFTRQFGLPPHRYLISRRIDEARRRLLDGASPAAVAVDVGFWDQAHLGRHFKQHVGVTPGRYRSTT